MSEREAQTAVGAARYAGRRVHRVEDARLLTGAATFVDDITRPGMLHACFVRSPHPRARIIAVDATPALDLPGVHAVFTAADLNGDVVEAWYTGTGKDVPDTPRPPLAEGEARFAGDPVAVVIAENRYLAEDAAELVVVDYEPLPAVADYATAQQSPERVHENYPGAGELPARLLLPKTENDILKRLGESAGGCPWSLSSTRISGCCGCPSARR